MTCISAEMQRMVGAELAHKVAAPISASDIRRWAIAIYYPKVPPRLFWDYDYAIRTSHRGIVAPEDFNPFAWAINEADLESQPVGYDPDWIEKTLRVEPPPLKRFLHGGMEVEYGVRMRPGDVIRATSSLACYEEKQGKMGVLLFTTVKNTWRNQDGTVVKRHWHHGIRF
jgi:hypothetical protein